MKKLLNFLLLLILVGALLFLAVKAKFIPNPLERGQAPDPTPQPTLVSRDQLRVAVAERPEKLLMSSLKRLLRVKNQQLELVDYNPDTVWLELAGGEIDLVIVPLGEAVKAQGRFKAGSFLFFTGLSTGLDQLLASPKAEQPKKVAVQHKASTDFLARQMLPEADVVSAESLKEVESWLKGGAVEAALIDTSANSPDLLKTFKVLKKTSPESPMPTVAVLSRQFADNASEKEYDKRREVLFAALDSWAGLVSYLDTQPELLKSTVNKEAEQAGINVDRLLVDYTFLPPGKGRALLLDAHRKDMLKQTLDLLVLAGVENLSAPDWDASVNVPTALDRGFEDRGDGTATTQPLPVATPEQSPTPVATPDVVTTPSPSATTPPPATSSQSSFLPTHHRPGSSDMPSSWPEAEKLYAQGALTMPPAVSSKRVMVLSRDKYFMKGTEGPNLQLPTGGEPTTPPLSDGRQFYLGLENKIAAISNTGKEVWKVEVQGRPLGLQQLNQEHIFYAVNEGDRGRLYCIDTVDGEVLWENVLTSPPASGPVLGNGKTPLVIVADQEGLLQAWNATDGTWQWKTQLQDAAYITPATGYGHLVIVEPQGTVRFFDLKEGKEMWDADLGTALGASPTLTSTGVLIPAKDTYLYHLSSSNGSIRWKQRLSHPMSEPAMVGGQTILQSDEGGKVHTLRINDGTLLNSQTVVNDGWVSRTVFQDSTWATVDQAGNCWIFSES